MKDLLKKPSWIDDEGISIAEKGELCVRFSMVLQRQDLGRQETGYETASQTPRATFLLLAECDNQTTR